MPQWRGSRETARTPLRRCGLRRLPSRNGGAVGRLPGRCPLDAQPDPWAGRNGGAVGRLPGLVAAGRSRRRRSRRNGGAVGRLPGPHRLPYRPPRCHRRNGGAVGRLPGHSGRSPGRRRSSVPQWRGSRETARTCQPTHRVRASAMPQWRGSRETARTGPPSQPQRSGMGAAMEGQSGDCPDMVDGYRAECVGAAAMEGQSGDCPDDVSLPEPWNQWWRRNGGAVGRLPGRRFAPGTLESVVAPQWRGSRETARTVGVPSTVIDVTAAAMEGQSGDCPDTESL